MLIVSSSRSRAKIEHADDIVRVPDVLERFSFQRITRAICFIIVNMCIHQCDVNTTSYSSLVVKMAHLHAKIIIRASTLKVGDLNPIFEGVQEGCVRLGD